MKSIWNLFLNIRFRNKLAVSYISMALIPFVIFTAVCGSVFLTQARNTTMAHTAQITSQVSSSIDVYISTIDKMADYVIAFLQRGDVLESTDTWERLQPSVKDALEDIATSHPDEIAGILIATEEDRYIGTGMSRISRDPFTGESWYRQAADHPGEIVLVSSAMGRNIVTDAGYSVDDVFSLAKAITHPKTGQVQGVVLFDIRHTIIKESINRVTIGKKGFVFVLDSSNNIVYTPVNSLVYRVNPAWLSESGQQPVTADIAGGQYQIRFDQSDYTRWRTVGVFSLDEVMASVNTVFYVLLLCIVLTVGLVLSVSFTLADSVTKPIGKLQRLMKQAESGDLTVRFNSLYNDEIGDLGHSFNHMIARIDHLIHRVYEEQRSKRDAELKSLQEQIKPHFLYNTLDTIGWMAREYNAEDIVKLVSALTNMFRIGLSHGKDYISVKEEITHISNYLYIQQIRYKDKLGYQIDVEEACLPILIPKLILQPLVENAIYHGIKQKRSGNITITGRLREAEQVLEFTVKDDGAGMPPERLQQLRELLAASLSSQEKQGFGLFYIEERIKLCYGEDYGVSLDSVPNEGTTVVVTLPAQGHH